jgi:hypothetical protein
MPTNPTDVPDAGAGQRGHCVATRQPHGEPVSEEERLVAELDLLGIRYLSRQTAFEAVEVRPADILLADLVRQRSSRVRTAVIAVLLSHPEYADVLPKALDRLEAEDRFVLESLCVASSLLQRLYEDRLRQHMSTRWRWLPDSMGMLRTEALPADGTARERLVALGRAHRRRTGQAVNWAGTFERVADRFLRQRELERTWGRQRVTC